MADTGSLLDDVSRAVLAAVTVPFPGVDAIVRYLPSTAGKGVRPRMTLLASAAVDPFAAPPVAVAAGVELIHLATLHHDDVADEAPIRRGRPTVSAVWGNRAATFAGTFLFARGTELLAAAGDAISRAAAACTAELWRGQTRELVTAYRLDRTEADYLSVVSDKTGSLLALACGAGALAAGAPADLVARFARFGRTWGTAFQLADDIADLTGSTHALGKAAATDLREGVYTLPVILALASGGPGADELAAILGRADPVPSDAERARVLVAAGPGLREARATLGMLVRTAGATLEGLPDTAAVAALHGMVDDLSARAARDVA